MTKAELKQEIENLYLPFKQVEPKQLTSKQARFLLDRLKEILIILQWMGE